MKNQKRMAAIATVITLGTATVFGAVVVNGQGGESRDSAAAQAAGSVPAAGLEQGMARIDPSTALIRSEIDGVTFLAGPRVGGDDLCFTVDVPSEVTMAGCRYPEDLLTKGAVYTASRDREPTVKTLYGIAPEGAVRMTAGQVAVDVRDRAFIVTVPRSVRRLVAVGADGSESAFPLVAP